MDLVPLLSELGLNKIRQRGDEITALCPMHERNLGRPDRNASWGINAETGLHQCFSCGFKGTLSGLYFELTGTMPGPELVAELVVAQFIKVLPNSGGDYDDDDEAMEEWDPGDLVPLSERMLKRRYLTSEAVEFYGVCWDRSRACWFVPIMDEFGSLLGAQYKQVGAVSNMPFDVKKSSTLFGLYQAISSKWTSVAVVESPLDVVRLYVAGVPAVASFGTMISKRQVELLNRHFTFVVRAFDNDAPGAQADEVLHSMLRRRGCPSVPFNYEGLCDPDGNPAKDPGDVEDDRILAMAWAKSRQVFQW
jgi:hypothetical protein